MNSGHNEIAEQELEQPGKRGRHLCFQGSRAAVRYQRLEDNASTLTMLGQVASAAGLRPRRKSRAGRNGLDRTLSGTEHPRAWTYTFFVGKQWYKITA